jgi:GNAT superfamily N-acetyltransferase
MDHSLPTGYRLKKGTKSDRDFLVKYMELTYQELYPAQRDFCHLRTTVNQYFGDRTPLWLVETAREIQWSTVACLWMGNAVDQRSGNYYAHIFLIFVEPEHRHYGIGKALIQTAENWARARGDRQIGIQVLVANHQALNLYQNAGFKTQSLSLIKPL